MFDKDIIGVQSLHIKAAEVETQERVAGMCWWVREGGVQHGS